MFSEGIDAALTAYEHRRKIREIGQWLWKRVTRGNARVVVFGAAGAGKSTLGAVLAGKEVGPDYKDSSHLETYSLQGGVPCVILVPPGQESLRAATWSDLLREIGTGQTSIVLHVVSWGLNPLGDQTYKESPQYEAGMNIETFAAAYFERQREQEIATIERFADQIALAPHKLSLITVVTKQDLWWGDRQQVRSFYQGGRYANAVTGIRNRLGDQNFSHKIGSASLLYRNLVDGGGNMLRPTTSGYDDKIKLRHDHALLELIRAEAAHE
ncbi:hypothetical protein DB30_02145 [Enhygromyxa salina]|uniref:G domain-containing protein n=1 Tax=Enhygromyxa salina TaxID=215803 RepID=A0A0C1ZM57_9BACT|nr:hypothetical protein [Enhygromyxa salina]KIG11993.1 hypothetical protein DB30_02145 [Enhygromyxa salina]